MFMHYQIIEMFSNEFFIGPAGLYLRVKDKV
jgi:hypothetical protein